VNEFAYESVKTGLSLIKSARPVVRISPTLYAEPFGENLHDMDSWMLRRLNYLKDKESDIGFEAWL